MTYTNSTQTQSFKGMTNQYDPQLHEEASFIHQLYQGATYIRIKYLDHRSWQITTKSTSCSKQVVRDTQKGSHRMLCTDEAENAK